MMNDSTRNQLIRGITTLAVITVAIIAAIQSYSHMHDLAYTTGEQWRAHLFPISVDGLVVAASMVLLSQQIMILTGRQVWLGHRIFAATALAMGVIVSLAANIADAWDKGPLARAIAGWPALAFATVFHLLLIQWKTVPGQERRSVTVASGHATTNEVASANDLANDGIGRGHDSQDWPPVITSHEWPSEASSGNGADSRTEANVFSPGVTWSTKTTGQSLASLAQAADRDQATPEPVAWPLATILATIGHDHNHGQGGGHDDETGQDGGQHDGQPVARPKPDDPEVARLLASELGHDEVAEELGCSARTVRRWRSAAKNGHAVPA